MTVCDGASRPHFNPLPIGSPADLGPTTRRAVLADLTDGLPLEQAIAGGAKLRRCNDFIGLETAPLTPTKRRTFPHRGFSVGGNVTSHGGDIGAERRIRAAWAGLRPRIVTRSSAAPALCLASGLSAAERC